MSDLQLPDRLTQLRSRWEADPASRIFLQLAEEYRHLGRLHEALAVLEAGLKEHPGYLSALVAKGRCLLDLGNPEPAREVLERVVRQDATQAVANKLLVRAYVETGQGARAKERLDLYSLLHDGDPEIEELRGRIRRLESGGPTTKTEKTEKPEPAPTMDEDPFSLPPPPRAAPAPPSPPARARAAAAVPPDPPAPRQEAADVFDLGPPPPRPGARAATTEVFRLDYPAPAAAAVAAPTAPDAPAAPAAPEAPAAPAAVLDEPEPTAEGEPFPGLVSRSVRERYLSGLAAEGLFPLGRLEAAPPAPPAPAARRVEPEPPPAPAPAPPPVAPPPAPAPPAVADHAPGEIFPLRSIGEAVEAELRRETPEPEPEPVPEPLLVPEPEPIPLARETPQLPQLPQLLQTTDFALEDLAEPAAEAPVEFEQVATVTLGELYLKQGHVGEAERIFEEVLRREPDNAAAREALAHLAAGREEPAAAAAPMPAMPALAAAAEPGAPGDRKQRKIRLLNSYLERIRRGSHPDVP